MTDTATDAIGPGLRLVRQAGSVAVLEATGSWTAREAAAIDAGSKALSAAAGPVSRVDLAAVTALDTFGAVLLQRLIRQLTTAGGTPPVLTGVPDAYRSLIESSASRSSATPETARPSGPLDRLADLGRAVERIGADLVTFGTMLGRIVMAAATTIRSPRRFRLTSLVHHVDRIGWQAVPIVLLITFLIGGIIAQQGFFHFRKFGAETYVVDMLGILVLREIGVLIVAIMVAGRSGSAITAELGSMKMREEIDALQTMGHDVTEVLVLPRVLALILVLPMLALLGSLSALYGGLLVAWAYAGMSPDIFIARLKEAISITHFKVGMIKAPFMALALGVVAAAEGMRVGGSAESLGMRTTASVVEAIFLVIVLDGVFAVFFASIGM